VDRRGTGRQQDVAAGGTGEELLVAEQHRALSEVRPSGGPASSKDRPDEVRVAGEGGGGQLAGGRVVMEQLDQSDVGRLLSELGQRLVATHGDPTPRS